MPTKKQIPEVEQRVIDRYASGRWLSIPRDFIHTLSSTESIILTTLIQMFEQSGHAEWFRCSVKDLEKQTRIKQRTQHYILVSLARRKLVFVKVARGKPPYRLINLNHTEILNIGLTGADFAPVPHSAYALIPPPLGGGPNQRCSPEGTDLYTDQPSTNSHESKNGDKMGFFPEYEKPKTSTPTRQDSIWADQLLHALRKRLRRMGKKVSVLKWANEFKLLRLEVKDDSAIDDTLEWYCSNIGKDYVPIALSADGFRKKFNQILLARKRDKSTPQQAAFLNRTAQQVYDWVSKYKWPQGSIVELPIAIQTSYDNLTGIFTILKDISNKQPSDRVGRIADLIINDFGTEHSFLERWFTQVFNSVKKWKKWSGSFTPFIISWDCKMLHNRMLDLCRRYAGTPKPFFMLMERVRSEYETQKI